ncbi:hypothetical protein WJX74_002195 [Apatococcus lobatus]|uniref:Uncharacterized protein n=1 Tax=Apatococcus lobatus TaxID=904363 RepID=A0AAW1Q4F4_9CHLO
MPPRRAPSVPTPRRRAAPARRATFDGGRIVRPPPTPPDLTNWVTVLGAGRTTPFRAQPLDEHFWATAHVPYPPEPRYFPDTTPDPYRPLSDADKDRWIDYYNFLIRQGLDPDGNPIPNKDLISFYKRHYKGFKLEDGRKIEEYSDAEIMAAHRKYVGVNPLRIKRPEFPAPPTPGRSYDMSSGGSAGSGSTVSTGRGARRSGSVTTSSDNMMSSGRVSGSGDMDISPSTSMSVSGSGSASRPSAPSGEGRRRRRSDTGSGSASASASGRRNVRHRPNPPSGSSAGGAAQRRARKTPRRKAGRKRATERRR